jgi:hypothetical protein
MVLFLAANPTTRENVERPLHGTASGRRFQLWLKLLGAPEHILMNASRKLGKVSYKDYDSFNVAEAAAQCDQYVALGTYASGLLDRLGIPHFTLPHPSGGPNRKINESEELARQLDLCRVYVARSRKGSP